MMFGHKRAMSRTAAALLIAVSTLALAGCGSMQKLNPFAEKDKPIPGERRPAFAPGTEFAGPRRLPPPNSDYVGATMPANQPVTSVPPAANPPANVAPPAPTTPTASGTRSVPAPPAPPTAQ
jgi:hypothetical protein